jgi:hypothetical protein
MEPDPLAARHVRVGGLQRIRARCEQGLNGMRRVNKGRQN